jgi:hypothetical protein
MLFIIAVVASGLQDKVGDGPRLTTCRQDGNVRKRTLRPNRVRAQFHDVVIAKDKAEDEPRLYLWCQSTDWLKPILRQKIENENRTSPAVCQPKADPPRQP